MPLGNFDRDASGSARTCLAVDHLDPAGHRMKADERTQAVPVVVLTSSSEEHDLAESYRLGVNSYVVKPVDFGRFMESVGSLGLYWMHVNQPPRRVAALTGGWPAGARR
jgi:AmiR/NasT family two-component response regulator